MFERLKRLFRKEKKVVDDREKIWKNLCPNDPMPKVEDGATKKYAGSLDKHLPENAPVERTIGYHELEKQLKTMTFAAIAAKNEQRQKSTLGHGLKSRHFRPRPSSEKRLWNLHKKPGKNFAEDD